MVKAIVGGGIAIVIGGSTYAVSQSDIVSNLSKNTGMTQERSQAYVNSIPQSELESFSKLGQDLVSDGQLVSSKLSSIDCDNYTYSWETDALSCADGKTQLQTLGNDEITLGDCYQALDSNLGDFAKSKMMECITDIDALTNDYDMPVTTALLDASTITDSRNTNAYNKSVLESVLKS